MAYESTLVDEVRYAEASDVDVYIRNKDIDANSDPTKSEVEDLLLKASNRIDRMTGRAWRTRQVSNVELKAKFTREQRGLRYRQRGHSSTFHGGAVPRRDHRRRRVTVFLPHIEIRSWDTAASPSGDSLEILEDDGVTDISANEGRGDDKDFVLDEKAGILRIDFSQFTAGPLESRGRVREPALVRVTYRYGNDESSPSTTGLSDSVPPDIKEACAKMVAADLLRTDQYGSLVVSGPEDVPNQTDAASAMWSGAMDIIGRYERRQIV